VRLEPAEPSSALAERWKAASAYSPAKVGCRRSRSIQFGLKPFPVMAAGHPRQPRMKTMFKKLMLSAAVAVAVAAPAHAHVSLEKGEAPVGSTYKAVFPVPHGCEGAPTNVVRVRVPEGVISAKPMPKAGWTLEKVKGKYEKTYDYYGTPTSEGIKEIVWSGGNLGDDEYDEFVLRGYLTPDLAVGETLYFLVVQECPEGKAERWIEIPAAGQSSDDVELPAPGIKLLEKAGSH
jgi:periplasmic copper chaperone A